MRLGVNLWIAMWDCVCSGYVLYMGFVGVVVNS